MNKEDSLTDFRTDAEREGRIDPLPRLAKFVLRYSEEVTELYLHDLLSWQEFESLVTHLAIATELKHGAQVQAIKNGRPGQNQHGSDVIAWVISDGKLRTHVYQAKRVAKLAPQDLHAAVRTFLDGEHADAARFYFATTHSVREEARLVRAWTECMARLASHGVQGVLWDKHELNQALRSQPKLVAEMFGDEIVGRFCERTEVWPRPERFVSEESARIGDSLFLRNGVMSMNVILPSERFFGVSALVSFSRSDLGGAQIVIPQDELVRWSEWRRYAPPEAARPYATPCVNDANGFFAGGRSFRARFDPNELRELDWILSEVYEHILAATRRMNNRWQVHRFKTADLDTTRPRFALATVRRDVWISFLHHIEKHPLLGESEEWIVTVHGRTLRVSSDRDTARYEEGVHVALEAVLENRFDLEAERVVIVWSPPPDFMDTKLGPRAWWDAETAHDWLMKRLLPCAFNSVYGNRSDRASWWPWRFGSPKVQSLEALPIDLIATTSARSLRFARELRIHDKRSLVEAVAELQLFFSIAHFSFSPEVYKGVLSVAIRLVAAGCRVDSYYIRSTLGLPQSSSILDGLHRLAEEAITEVTSSWIEMVLRALLALLKDADDLDDGLRLYAAEGLDPLWAIYHGRVALERWWS